MDLHELSARQIEAMALIIQALGIVYWLMRGRDDRFKNFDSG